MSVFAYRDGELARRRKCRSAQIAAAVGTPFYLYSAGALAAQYRALCRAPSRRIAPLICYAVKANSNLAVLRLLCRPRRRRRRRLRRRAAARARRRGAAASASSSPASARRATRWRRRSPPASARSTSSWCPNCGGSARSPRPRADRPGRDPGQPRCRRADPRQDLDRHARRTSSASTSDDAVAAYRLAAELPGIEPVGLAVHIGSQLDRPRPVPARLRAARRAGRRTARRGPRGAPARSRRRHRHPLPRRDDRSSRPTMPRWSRESVRPARSRAGLRAGACACRRSAGLLVARGGLRQGGRDPPVRRPRRGDERPDPAGAVRCVARHRAGAPAGARRRA